LKKLSTLPKQSIPNSHNGWHETKAAYRLMSNEKVSFEKLLKVHKAPTLKRIEEHDLIITAQDTSELDYENQHSKSGRGPTNQKLCCFFQWKIRFF
jgi:hypothetical protein